MRDWVDVLHLHLLRHVDADGGIVEDGFDPRLHEQVRRFLRRCGRHGQHRHLNLVLFDLFDHAGCVENAKISHGLPHFFRVVIEHHAHVEAAIGEPVVMGERVTDIAHADDDHLPHAIHFQDVF